MEINIRGSFVSGFQFPQVWINGLELEHKDARKKIFLSKRNIKFEWGSTDSGAELLAFAILFEFTTEPIAKDLRKYFMHEYIAPLNSKKNFLLTLDIEEWILNNAPNKYQAILSDIKKKKYAVIKERLIL